MYVYLYVAVTILLPTIAFLLFLQNRRYFSFYWWILFLHFVLMYALLFQTGAWPYFGMYWRYLLGGLFALIYFLRFQSIKKKALPKAKRRIFQSSIALVFCASLTYFNWNVLQANQSNVESIDLSFPLKNGTYVIQQGGNSEITNISHRSRIPASNALDIFKLNKFGMRGSRLFSTDVTDYAIYGDTIYSPCNCTVTTIADGFNDNIPPHMETVHRGGNLVRLKMDDIHILLCHMQMNSLFVKKGQQVKMGDPLGLVGNTGFSIEPHLHIQAYHKDIRGAEQVAILFDGKFLKLNDMVKSNPK